MNPFYRTIRTICRPILRALNRLEGVGLENAILEGPAIVVANHHSYLDAFVLGAVYPAKIRFMVKRSQMEKPGTRWFYWGMDAFAVNQDGRDMESLREALRTLSGGGILGIFPAGERVDHAEPGVWMSGVGMIARKSRAPVIPVALLGTYRSMPVGAKLPKPCKVKVVVGEAVRYDPESDGKDLAGFVEDLRRRVAWMLLTGEPARSGELPQLPEAAGSQAGKA